MYRVDLAEAPGARVGLLMTVSRAIRGVTGLEFGVDDAVASLHRLDRRGRITSTSFRALWCSASEGLDRRRVLLMSLGLTMMALLQSSRRSRGTQ